MNFGANLLQYANSIGISSQKELAETLQENEKTISSYITGKSCPTYKKLIKLCNLLKCDPNTLMKGDFEYVSSEISQQDQQIISAYHNLNSSEKQRIVDFILGIGEYDTSKIVESDHTPIYRFPMFDQEAAAGVGRLDVSDGYSMEEFKVDNIPDNAVFAMEIAGESMYDEKTNYLIRTGSKVLIDPKIEKYNLDDMVVIVSFKGKVICKRYIIKENYILFQSDNDDFKKENRKSIDDPAHKIIGVVLGVIEDNKFKKVK